MSCTISLEVHNMKIHRIDHVGINVLDLSAARAFFVDLGMEVQGEGELEGEWLDEIVGLKDVKTAYVFLRTPEGETNLELIRYYRPTDQDGIRKPLANTPGIRHIALAVDDIEAIVAKLKKNGTEIFSEVKNYEDTYKLCYIRGPEGIILELAEKIG